MHIVAKAFEVYFLSKIPSLLFVSCKKKQKREALKNPTIFPNKEPLSKFLLVLIDV